MNLKIGSTARFRARMGGPSRAAGAMAVAVALAVGHAAPALAAGDADHGAKIYHDCMICHALDRNGVGPSHRNVFGRVAGSVANYNYSAALKASNIVWNETTLDQWLANPQALVPGSKMMFSVSSARDRADVIAFLKEKATNEVSSAAPSEK